MRSERLERSAGGEEITIRAALGIGRVLATIAAQAAAALFIAMAASVLIRARFRATADRITRATSDIIERVSTAARAAAAGNDAIWRPSPPGGVLEIEQLDEAARQFATSLAEYRRLLTETREAAIASERRAAASEAIARTVQMIAHDVRKPFSKMRAGLSLLRNARSSERADQLVGRLIPEVDGTIASVNRMLADVMHHGADAPLHSEIADARDLIDTALREVFQGHPEADVEITSGFNHSSLALVDVAKIQRVLQNIVENAIQAMGGRGHLWLLTKESDGHIEFTIGNSGSSIAPEDLPHLFDAFFTKGKRGGTGLGLAIAREIIEKHQGSITCRSEAGRGVEFVLRVPCSGAVSEATPQPLPSHSSAYRFEVGLRHAEEPRQQECQRPVVAVVEDDIFCAEDWEQTLSRDVDCAVFSNPESFIDRVASDDAFAHQLCLVVTDYNFDGSRKTGADVAKAIYGRVDVPVLLASGAELPSAERAIFSGIIGKTAVGFAALTGSIAKEPRHARASSVPTSSP
jgi:signal transduction histidine kinase